MLIGEIPVPKIVSSVCSLVCSWSVLLDMIVRPCHCFFEHDIAIVSSFAEKDKPAQPRDSMADEQAHQHTVLGELSPPGPGELTVMRRLDVQGNPEAYELKVLEALDSSLLRRKLIDYHDGGLSLVSRLKAKFGRSLVTEVAVIRLVSAVHEQRCGHMLNMSRANAVA